MIGAPEFDDDGEMMETIKQALEQLLEKGLVEIIGIDGNGEWLYQATPKGIEFNKKRKNLE